MIDKNRAIKYCKNDISLIENYDKAIADKTQVWHCHHRRETIFSKSDLIEIGEYYNRPACELIFLTPNEHHRLHNLGKPSGMNGKHHSAETRKKISEALKGKPSGMNGKHLSAEARKKMSESKIGKHHSEEHKLKISAALKGENNPMFGKHHSAEARNKMSEANKGKHHSAEARKKISQAMNGKNHWTKGTNWYNNGVICVRAKTCPEGFLPGRIVCNKRA